MNQYLEVISGEIQMRNKEQRFMIIINYFCKLPHEDVNPLTQAQVPFWETYFRQIQDVEPRIRVAG